MTGLNTTTGQSTLPTPNSTKSFWHSEPSQTLLGHRTTTRLPVQADVVIIGSGITGASAAHWFREHQDGQRLNVVMLEAREACWGATGRNGGHCQPILYDKPPDVANFELQNYHALQSLISTHRIPCDWRSLSGCHAYMASNMFALRLKAVQELSKSNPELARYIQIITPETTNPSLADLRVPGAAGAFVQTFAASLWPYKLVCWVLERLLEGNAEEGRIAFNLQTGTPATHIQRVDSAAPSATTSTSAPAPSTPPSSWIIHTPRGQIATPRVVLATNGYTSHLLPSFADLIVPVRGEMSALVPPMSVRPSSEEAGQPRDGVNPLAQGKPLEYTYGFIGNGRANIEQDDYLVQRPFVVHQSGAGESAEKHATGGELMFGGGRAYARFAGVGVSDDSEIDGEVARYLRRELDVVMGFGGTQAVEGKAEKEEKGERRPEGELKATHEWSGIMGYSRDGRPWVGEVTAEVLGFSRGEREGGEGLWICAGFTGHGMPNAWLAAKAVVEGMMGREREKACQKTETGEGERDRRGLDISLQEETRAVTLPQSYKVSRDRIDRARRLDEVSIADANAMRAEF